MKCYLIFGILLINIFCSAQHFEYAYDQAGNRIQRSFIPPRLANPEQIVQEKQFGIKVFPNPAPDKVNIRIESLEIGENASVYLSDEHGKILYKIGQAAIENEISLFSYKSGVYYIKVILRNEEIVYKVIKL